ncbi:hypothetical protein [Chondromyces apiculatus]|uniref:Glycosyltransferase RgtA/B/C/D-like domain-containing protein n=1 Tax=Chondromyces apiculatus DSM 436 TaxID=1192034 RepID=A0A017T8K0_9BACT|nr:hypothetical protein [Chondromyces apiculatus]EYF05539.1 Hypothetical protein CAP_3087 [Chondromyces apiculatus DSM 436]
MSEPREPVPEAGEPQVQLPATSFGAWLRGAPLPERWHLVLGLILPLTVLLLNVARLSPFTIDDAYISYRYARNFARGLGLVYNAGEQIEGYTNFLWTILLAAGVRVGFDPDVVAKVLGAAAACGTLWITYLLERRLLPLRSIPCLAPWLLASSIAQAGYAVFGLETSLFIFLVLAGTELLFRESDREHAARGMDDADAGAQGEARAQPGTLRRRLGAFPFSGLLFGLAGLTRPEAPMFLGIPMLFLGLRFFGVQNLLRGALFVLPVGLHMLWRHGYYGTWLPNTLSAKTGNLTAQLHGGVRYLSAYAAHAWPALALALYGFCLAIMLRHRRALCLGAVALAVLGYVLLVGGDWMPGHRFVAPFEPYAFALAGMGGRAILDATLTWTAQLRHATHATHATKERRSTLSAAMPFAVLFLASAALVGTGAHRSISLGRASRRILHDDKVFWDSAAGGVAAWFEKNGQPGEIGVGDIGYIGYATDYPILDLLGLVDPVISRLPGGYTQKIGDGYVRRVFDKMPRYFVFVGSADTCDKLPFPAQEKLRRDRRFQRAYQVAGRVRHSKGGYWCIFERPDLTRHRASLPTIPAAPAPEAAPAAPGAPTPAAPAAPAPETTPTPTPDTADTEL